MAGEYCTSGRLATSKAQEVLDRINHSSGAEGYDLAMIPEERYPHVIDLIENHALPDEPVYCAFDVQWDKSFEDMVMKILRQNLSVMAVSEEGQIVAVRLNEVMKRDEDPYPAQMANKALTDSLQFEGQYSCQEFFKTFGVEEAIHFSLVCVHTEFRRRGLAGKLIRASVALSAELGFKAIKAEATSNFTQRIFEKEGFSVLREMPYDEYVYMGQPLRNKTGPHTSTKIVGKAL